jgi:hypothetical protein
MLVRGAGRVVDVVDLVNEAEPWTVTRDDVEVTQPNSRRSI